MAHTPAKPPRASTTVRTDEIRPDTPAPIAVYSTGKVSSTAFHRMLKNHPPRRAPLYKLHSLRFDNLGAKIAANPNWESEQIVQNLLEARRQLNAIARSGSPDPRGRWRFISMIRDPVATNLSAFFHHHDLWMPGWIERFERAEVSVADMLAIFLAKHNHRAPLEWFDMEYKAVFGIDIHDHPFPHEQGYQILRSELADFFIIRAEDTRRVPISVIENFTGLQGLKLERALEGSKRPYAAMYKAFKDAHPLPAAYVDEIYAHPVSRHFYTTTELATFRAKHLGPNA